eukprot:COSAG02_NODE_6876_length_3315_cov_2.046671_1_plen_848_part_00
MELETDAEAQWAEQRGADEAVSEGQPPSSPTVVRSPVPVGPADALRALVGALTQELASMVAERQQVADIARQHQQRRERVVSLEQQLAAEQKRNRAARRQATQGLSPAERRRRAREPAPDSVVAHELEVAEEQLVESLNIIQQRYTDEAALTARAERSTRALHAAQAQFEVQQDSVERLEQTVRGLGDEVVRLRQLAQDQADAMRQTINSHNIEMQQIKEATGQEISRLMEEIATGRQEAAEETRSELHRSSQEAAVELQRVSQEAAAELQRVKQEAASEKQRLIQNAAAERQRLVEEAAAAKQRLTTDAAVEKRRLSEDAAAEKQRLVEQAAAEKQRVRDDASCEIKRIKEDAAAEIMRIHADSAAEKQQLIQRHGQLLQSARAEARAEALGEATRTIEYTKAEAARESRIALAAVEKAASAASQAEAKVERSRTVISEHSSAVTAAEASSEGYEDTLETLSKALLGLRKTNAQLVAQQVDGNHRVRSAEDRMAELEKRLQHSISQREQMQAQRDEACSESRALRNGRAALRSELATITQRLEAVMQANHEASGRLLTAEYALLIASDGRPRLLEQVEGAARCLLQETEQKEAKLAKGIEAIYLAFASGGPVVDKLKRYAAVAATSSATTGSNPSGEVEALRSALAKLCSNEAHGSGVSAPTNLQKQLQEDCGLTKDDCTIIVDRLIKHTLEQQMLSGAKDMQAPAESAFKVFLRLGWECLCDEHKQQSISNKFGILVTETVMVAEGQQAWARRTVILRGDCLLMFGEKEYEALGVAPRIKIALRTASVGQLVEIPSASHPVGVVELAFSVSAGDVALFWVRAADQRLTRQLHLSVLTAQRSSASQ